MMPSNHIYWAFLTIFYLKKGKIISLVIQILGLSNVYGVDVFMKQGIHLHTEVYYGSYKLGKIHSRIFKRCLQNVLCTMASVMFSALIYIFILLRRNSLLNYMRTRVSCKYTFSQSNIFQLLIEQNVKVEFDNNYEPTYQDRMHVSLPWSWKQQMPIPILY